MRAYNDTILNSNTGRPLIGAQMRVLTQAGFGQPPSGLATIYADANMTPAPNPMTIEDGSSASPGFGQFYAPDGFYTIEYLYAGQPIRTVRDVDISADVSHAEIEDETGASIIGTPSGTVQTDLNARPDRDDLGIALFAGSASSPNIAPAIEAARQEAIAGRKEILIPGGLYTTTETLDFSGTNLRTIGNGMVFIQSSASPIAKIDAGAAATDTGNLLENFVFIGDGSADQVGLYVRNTIQSVRRNIWVRNVAGKAFDIEGDVLTLYDTCRSTHAGVPDSVRPKKGWHIRKSTYLTGTAACTFINCISEVASEHGWLLEDTHDCAFLGGTSEGLPGVGMELASSTSGNTFTNFFYEMNTGDDLVDGGKGNRHVNCTMASTNALSVRVKDTAVGCVVEGGDSFHSIEVESGAVNTTFRNFECVNFTDAGTGTVRQDFKIQFDSGARYPGQTLGNVESFDPKVLDWYEQGSVTASLGGSTGDGSITQTGTTTYTRIGDRVFFETTINVSTASSWPTGNLLIRTGLPWNAAVDYTPSLGRLRNITIPASCDQFWLDGVATTPNVRIWGLRKDGGAPDIATAANLTGSEPVDIQISGCMKVAS